MRYYSYNEMTDDGGNEVITLSEEEIKETYYPYWYGKMCEKIVKKKVDETYTFEDRLDDWIVVNWAWESN